jgi:predicted nucleic acid-binding protein
MPIIVDANLLVALVSGDPRGDWVSQSLLDWVEQGVELHAPELAKYEVANALTRLIVGNAFPADRAEEALNDLLILPITYHALTNARRVIEISLRLKRQSAYDAAYLALAESLNAGVYTLDGPLYRNATAQGFNIQLLQQRTISEDGI